MSKRIISIVAIRDVSFKPTQLEMLHFFPTRVLASSINKDQTETYLGQEYDLLFWFMIRISVPHIPKTSKTYPR